LRYSELVEAFDTSTPATISTRGLAVKPTSNANSGPLKSLRSTVSWLVTKSYQSLPARLKTQFPLMPIDPSGRPKRKSGLFRGL